MLVHHIRKPGSIKVEVRMGWFLADEAHLVPQNITAPSHNFVQLHSALHSTVEMNLDYRSHCVAL